MWQLACLACLHLSMHRCLCSSETELSFTGSFLAHRQQLDMLFRCIAERPFHEICSWSCRDYSYGQRSTRGVKHPHDCSIQTLRGHTVSTTLIRAHWSPMHTTGQRFVYTGSSDGHVYIYGEPLSSRFHLSRPPCNCLHRLAVKANVCNRR